jgi:hypothetical protein
MNPRAIEVIARHPQIPGRSRSAFRSLSWHDQGACGEVGLEAFFPGPS